MSKVPISEGSRLFYKFAWLVMNLVFRVCFRWKIEGRDNLPPTGGVIVCANHFSYWDPPNVGCALNRRVYFMAKEELFLTPILGTVIRWLGAFPVKRGTADRRAIRRAIELLNRGEVLGLFPEGTREKDRKLGEAELGAAMLAVKTGAPVVPVAITGEYRLFRPVTVKIGRPITFNQLDDARGSSASLQAVSNRIMNAIAELLNEGKAKITERELEDVQALSNNCR